MPTASKPDPLGFLGARIRLTRQQVREDWRSFLYDHALVAAYTERGGLVCEWGAKLFRIGPGLTAEVRKKPPKIGAKIRFSYRGTNWRGYPHAPALVEVTSAPASPPSPQAAASS